MVATELVGERVAALDRRGKYLIVRFESGRALLIHLRMTGSLLSDPQDASHVRAVVSLDDGTSVVYRDVRRFGTWLLLEPGELEPYLAARVGAEPLGRVHRARARGAARGPPRADQGRDPRPAHGRGRREHLRRRGALVRAPPPAAAGRQPRPGRAAPAASRDPPRARARHPPAGLDALRVPAPRRLVGLDAARVQGLRPRGRALRPLRHADREDARRRPRHLVLPELPASTTQDSRARPRSRLPALFVVRRPRSAQVVREIAWLRGHYDRTCHQRARQVR